MAKISKHASGFHETRSNGRKSSAMGAFNATYPQGASFGALLKWHLRENGTRPDIKPGEQGVRWSDDEFGTKCNVRERNLSNWFRNKNVRANIIDVENALFGASDHHDAWRRDLREARASIVSTGQETGPCEAPEVAPEYSGGVQPSGLIQTSGTPSTISNVPKLYGVPRWAGLCEGRDTQIFEVRTALNETSLLPENAKRVAVHGLGGVGKSSLAREYVSRFQSEYAGVCWCSAERREDLVFALSDLSKRLGFVQANETNMEFGAQVALQSLAQNDGRWLFIFDNATDPASISNYLPSAPAHLIITSRFSDWSDVADPVYLDVLKHSDATHLLAQLADRKDIEGAQRLATVLDCLPLALNQAGVYCRRTKLAFSTYADRAEELIKKAPAGADYSKAVFATFSLAIKNATAEDAAANELMKLLSHCGPEPIPLFVINQRGSADPYDIDGILPLAEVSLIQLCAFEDEEPGITVHRLVQSVGRSLAKTSGTTRDSVTRLVDCLSASFPGEVMHDQRYWGQCEKLLPHVLAIHDRHHAEISESKNHIWVLGEASHYLTRRAEYATAEKLARDCIELSSAKFGNSSVELARALSALGWALREQDNLDEAHDVTLRVLEIARHNTNSPDVRIANTLGALGELAIVRGQLLEARGYIREALQIYDNVEEEDYDIDSVATLLSGDGRIASMLDEHTHAIESLQKVLEIRESRYGPEHFEVALALQLLGGIYINAGVDLDEAKKVLKRAYDLRCTIFGAEHPETAESLQTLATANAWTGDYISAVEMYSEAIRIKVGTLGDAHHLTASSRRAFGHLLASLGRVDNAIDLYELAIYGFRAALGAEHPDTLEAISELAEIHARRSAPPNPTSPAA